MNQPFLSFVIPVYNVEQYLDECVNSILSQADGQCEIILVDDGSTDGSGSICDRFGGTYDYITVIHKPNGGLSSARNAGMEIAQGKYITFVDSDDKIAAGSLAQILTWVKTAEVDICFLEAFKLFPDGSTQSLGDCIEPSMIRGKPKDMVFAHLASRPKYPGSACTKLFRTQYLAGNDLHFPKDKRHSEDLGFIRDCLLVAETFDALSMPYYEYRQNRPGSITAQISARSFFDLSLFVKETAAKTAENQTPRDTICECVLSFAAYEYSILLWQYSRLPHEDRMEAKKFLKEYQWVLRYGQTKKLLMVRAAQKILGTNGATRLLGLYMAHR